MSQAIPSSTISHSPPTDWWERGLLVAWSLLLFAMAYGLNIRHNQFPYYYHPDEPGKVEQIMTGRFNFNHPMLLLESARIAAHVKHTPSEPQRIVELGRAISAAFTSGAVVMLSLVAFLWRGWRAGLLAGAALMLHHQLYELSHYFKEDAAFLFGVSCALLAGMAYSQRPSLWRACVLGGAMGIALSGKYLGAIMFFVVLPVLWVGARRAADLPAKGRDFLEKLARFERQTRLHWILFVATLVIVFAAINHTLLLNLASFSRSFGKEVGLVVSGQGNATRSAPHALYWNVFVDNTTPVIWILLIALVVVCIPRWRQLSLFQKELVIFPFALAIALSFSPKENDRYFLPATAVFTLLAAIGVEAVPFLLASIGRSLSSRASWRFLKPRVRRAIFIGFALLLLTFQISGWAASKPGWSQYDAAFVRDDIAALVEWMTSNLPPQAIVAADSRVGLPNPDRESQAGRGRPVPQKLLVAKLAAEKGSLAQLRTRGVTYVAISESSYGRFFRSDLRPKIQGDSKFYEARAFYEELLRDGDPLFERDRGTVIYLHPGIRVYQIQASQKAAGDEP